MSTCIFPDCGAEYAGSPDGVCSLHPTLPNFRAEKFDEKWVKLIDCYGNPFLLSLAEARELAEGLRAITS